MDVEINDEAEHTFSFIKEAETAPEVQTSLSHVTHCSFLKLDFRPRHIC